MTDAERKLLEQTVASLISLQGWAVHEPKTFERLLDALKDYNTERDYITSTYQGQVR